MISDEVAARTGHAHHKLHVVRYQTSKRLLSRCPSTRCAGRSSWFFGGRRVPAGATHWLSIHQAAGLAFQRHGPIAALVGQPLGSQGAKLCFHH
jgi:hypothetical protein